MLFTFKTVALAVLAVVTVGNVQGAPLPSSSSPIQTNSLVESSATIADSQTEGPALVLANTRYVSLSLISVDLEADDTSAVKFPIWNQPSSSLPHPHPHPHQQALSPPLHRPHHPLRRPRRPSSVFTAGDASPAVILNSSIIPIPIMR